MGDYVEMYTMGNREPQKPQKSETKPECLLRKWISKSEIVFVPDDPEYENVVLDQYQSHQEAMEHLDSIKTLYQERGITTFVKKKDRTETKWIRDMTGEIEIRRRPILGCTLF